MKWYTTQLKRPKRPNVLPKSLRFCASSGRCFCTFGTAEAGYSALCGANFSPDLSKVSGKCWEDFCTRPREIYRNPIFPKCSKIKIQKVFAFCALTHWCVVLIGGCQPVCFWHVLASYVALTTTSVYPFDRVLGAHLHVFLVCLFFLGCHIVRMTSSAFWPDGSRSLRNGFFPASGSCISWSCLWGLARSLAVEGFARKTCRVQWRLHPATWTQSTCLGLLEIGARTWNLLHVLEELSTCVFCTVMGRCWAGRVLPVSQSAESSTCIALGRPRFSLGAGGCLSKLKDFPATRARQMGQSSTWLEHVPKAAVQKEWNRGGADWFYHFALHQRKVSPVGAECRGGRTCPKLEGWNWCWRRTFWTYNFQMSKCAVSQKRSVAPSSSNIPRSGLWGWIWRVYFARHDGGARRELITGTDIDQFLRQNVCRDALGWLGWQGQTAREAPWPIWRWFAVSSLCLITGDWRWPQDFFLVATFGALIGHSQVKWPKPMGKKPCEWPLKCAIRTSFDLIVK